MSAEYDPSGCAYSDYPPKVRVADYMDANGAVYFVSLWVTDHRYRTVCDGRRVKDLPPRETREEAQRDLDAYAPRHGLREVV